MPTPSFRALLTPVLALTLALAACGGDDEGSNDSAGSTGTQTAAETQPATTASDPAADAEKAAEVEARGTMDAFTTAIDDADEDVFCGIVTEELLTAIQKGLTVAGCLEGLEGKQFGRALKGAKSVDVEVDGDVAAGRLRTRQGTFVMVTMRKREGRWMVKGLS